MIESLHIENIAVVRTLDVDFGSGMTALSGETGAGKSIMIDSINLLLGGRADRDLIRSGESRAEVSAVFSRLSDHTRRLLDEMGLPSEDSLMLSRTLTPGGSAARLNGRAIPISMLREIGATLLSIHGQHDNQQLLDPHAHMGFVDRYVGAHEVREAYAAEYRRVLHLRNELDSLETEGREQARLLEVLRFQIAEIDAVKVKEGEEQALEELAKKLRAAEQIEKSCILTERALQGGEKGRGAIYLVERAAAAMLSISDAVPEAGALAERLNNIRYELSDISDSLDEVRGDDSSDVLEKLDRVEGRLDAIAKLKRKYGENEKEILEFRREAAERLALIENADVRREDLMAELREAEATARKTAAALSEQRRVGAKALTEAVLATLRFLDMPKVRFEVAVRPIGALSAGGLDEVEFMVSANPGEPLYPMAKIASGGELARIMLSLKHALNVCDGVDTVIFDEIDTGISGKTSRKVGIKLKEIGRDCQVISVTHSAQIASLAHHHLFLSKAEANGRVYTTVRELDAEGRIGEIARILGGIEITDAQRQAAMEMIAEGEQYG